MRDRASMVCKDCGEVTHVRLPLLKPGSMVACGACGLVTSPANLRMPPALGVGAGAAEPPGRRGPVRVGLRR